MPTCLKRWPTRARPEGSAITATTQRLITGELRLPHDAVAAASAQVLVELRDVSRLDAPSVVLASTVLASVSVAPGARLPFELSAPEAAPSASLSLRAQLDVTVPGAPACYLSTVACPVAATGDVHGLALPLTRI